MNFPFPPSSLAPEMDIAIGVHLRACAPIWPRLHFVALQSLAFSPLQLSSWAKMMSQLRLLQVRCSLWPPDCCSRTLNLLPSKELAMSALALIVWPVDKWLHFRSPKPRKRPILQEVGFHSIVSMGEPRLGLLWPLDGRWSEAKRAAAQL